MEITNLHILMVGVTYQGRRRCPVLKAQHSELRSALTGRAREEATIAVCASAKNQPVRVSAANAPSIVEALLVRHCLFPMMQSSAAVIGGMLDPGPSAACGNRRWLFVIARNSSFTFKGQAIDVKRVGRELGVRYVLEGSVRKAGGRVRITAQLIDAITGTHLW